MIKKRNRYIWVMLSLVGLMMVGCHVSKKVAEKETETTFEHTHWTGKKIAKAIEVRHFDFNTLSAKLYIDYKDDKKSFKHITTYIRMKKDSAIWLSIRPFMGIEMMKVLITPDSIKLHNNLKGKVVKRSIKDISEVIHIPFDFSVIQALLVGNPIAIPQKIKTFEVDSSQIHVRLTEGLLKSTYQWSRADFLLRKSHYQLDDRGGFAAQNLKGYQKDTLGYFARERNILVKDTSEMNLHLIFDKIQFNKEIAFPFP